MLESLSFVTTSLDRGQNLLLQCSWLKFNKFCGKYVIVDGSIKNQISKFKVYDFVEYYHLPGIGPVSGCVYGMQKVYTDYSTYIGDDDIPLLDGYQACVTFLDKNMEFDSCRADASYVNHEKLMNFQDGSNFRWALWCLRSLSSARYGKSTDLNSSESLIRLKSIASNYTVTQFFVSKTTKNKIVFGDELSGVSDVHLYEYVSCFAHAILMKTASIKGVYLLRGYGSYRPNSQDRNERHKYRHDSLVEAQLLKYCKSICSSAEEGLALYRCALSKRYENENNRVLGVCRQLHFNSWFIQQIQRFVFASFCQIAERFRFLKWVRTSTFFVKN